MNAPWLLIDGHFLAHRAFHAIGPLSHDGTRTEIVYGFLRDVKKAQAAFFTDRVVFTFDHGQSKRKELHPEYKANRKPKTDEERQQRASITAQIDNLKHHLLSELGYRNIFFRDGYEADDVIASVCDSLLPGDEAVIVSSDADLLQLIGRRISMWNPRSETHTTLRTLAAEYKRWGQEFFVDLKSLAGCPTDNIKGVDGVGPVRAAAFLKRELPANSKAYQAIERSKDLWTHNRKLIKLPLAGIGTFPPLREDHIDRTKWNNVMRRLGVKTLLD